MTTTATAHNLRTTALHWTDLRQTLGTTPTTWPPTGLRTYLTALEQYDADEARQLRSLERSPEQLGHTAAPLSIRVLDTMRTVETALVATADQIADAVQRPVMSPLPAGYPEADRRRRELLVLQDRRDPRRWRWTGTRPGAPYAALWLLARIQGAPGPFRPLTEAHSRHIARVAAEAARRVEHTLDLADHRRTLTDTHPCPCGGHIEVYGGAGAQPVARCRGCGALWTESGVVAA
ncbi:hypothetical protein [Streptomyces sp. CC228A]|uniref:hypothetical protein n=1 Tax=Streptomyces sp. CC228A TaxID=2898186 RepID=UPI001F24DE2B|nr:hypothetical protein [Streptomyces sp. CC228A]